MKPFFIEIVILEKSVSVCVWLMVPLTTRGLLHTNVASRFSGLNRQRQTNMRINLWDIYIDHLYMHVCIRVFISRCTSPTLKHVCSLSSNKYLLSLMGLVYCIFHGLLVPDI